MDSKTILNLMKSKKKQTVEDHNIKLLKSSYVKKSEDFVTTFYYSKLKILLSNIAFSCEDEWYQRFVLKFSTL